MTPTDDGSWSRISPLSMIHQGIGFIQNLVGSNPAPLLGLLAGAYAFAQRSPLMMVTTLIGLLSGGLTLLVIAWLRFRYRVVGDRIEVQSGVMTRQSLSLDFERVQNVRIETPLYFRPFGLARLSIESAGSSDKEIHLPGIPSQQAMLLRDRALHVAGSGTDASSEPESDVGPAQAESSEDLLKRRPTDLIIYGISSPAILWGAAITASLIGALLRQTEQTDNASAALEPLMQRLPDWITQEWLAAGAILVLLFLMTLFSIIMALVRYQGYELCRAGDRYQLRSGLLTEHDQGLRQHRIQHIRLTQSWVARLFRRHHLTCYQIGRQHPEQPDGTSQNLMAPALTSTEQHRLLGYFMPGLNWDSLTFRRVSRRYMRPKLVYWMSIWALVVGLLLYEGASAWFLASAPVPPLLVLLNWSRQGWCLDGDYMILRGGLFGCYYTVFAAFRGQTVRVHSSPFQRAGNLANLSLRLSSGAFTLPFIARIEAMGLADELLYKMETSRAPWL